MKVKYDTNIYDGFSFYYDDDDYAKGTVKLMYYDLIHDNPEDKGIPIKESSLGDTYHVCITVYDDETKTEKINCIFEAVFVDPLYYAKSLLPNFITTMVRKTNLSTKWFNDFLREHFTEDEIKRGLI
jgi:hypothetical protein